MGANQNIIEVFGQEVVSIPINDTTSTKLTPEADEDLPEADPEG